MSTAKNYLDEFELDQMQRIVSAYLDMAEMQARRRIPMTMEDWEKRLSGFLTLWDRDVLRDAGRVSAEIAKTHAETEFEKYRIVQDRLFQSDFDRLLLQIEKRTHDF
ncbi:RhuM family protein [Acidovorax sp.]|uniref:RhuM family protein n=1 Tax=Acidovorax sp. TaxID=1872122 RepID=UPI0039E4BA1F